MIAEAIIELLLENAGVTNLIQDRIEPNIIKPDTIYPVAYVSSDRMDKLNCSKDRGIRNGVIEIGVYTETYGSAGSIINAIRAALDDFSGNISGVGITIMRGRELPDGFDKESGKHVKVIEFEAVAQLAI